MRDGRVAFPGGASYRLIVLPRHDGRMTLATVTGLRDLVAAGAVVMGAKPTGSPSLSSHDAAVRTVADQLWGDLDGMALTGRAFGKGRIYWRQNGDVPAVPAEKKVAVGASFPCRGVPAVATLLCHSVSWPQTSYARTPLGWFLRASFSAIPSSLPQPLKAPKRPMVSGERPSLRLLKDFMPAASTM